MNIHDVDMCQGQNKKKNFQFSRIQTNDLEVLRPNCAYVAHLLYMVILNFKNLR